MMVKSSEMLVGFCELGEVSCCWMSVFVKGILRVMLFLWRMRVLRPCCG